MVMKTLRNKKVIKRVVFVLACLIIPAFVLWGVGSAVRNRKNMPFAGTVFGRKVQFAEFVDAWQKARQFAIEQFGDKVDTALVDEIAWNRIILLDEAKKRNISATDADVASVVARMAQFQRNGRFDADYYKAQMGYRLRKFEELMKEDITIAKLKQEIISDVDISDDKLLDEYKKRNRKAVISEIFVDPLKYQDSITVSEAELQDFYNQNKGSFKTQPQINLRYILLSTEKMKNDLEVSDEEAQDYYKFNKDNYIIEEDVDDSMISEEEVDAITDTVDSEAEPAALDTDTTKLELVNQDTAVSSDKNTDDTPEEIQYKPLEEVKAEIIEALKNEKLEAHTKAMVRKIEDNLYENFDLNKLAEEFSFDVKETGFFSKNQPIPNIGFSYPLAQAAFALETIDDISDMIKTPEGYYVVQLKDTREPYIPGFDEIRDEVKMKVLQAKSQEIAQAKAEEFSKAIKDAVVQGKTFEEAAQSLGLETATTEPFSINGYIPQMGLSQEISEKISAMKAGDISGAIPAAKGSYIIKLDKIIEIDMAVFEQDKEEFKQNILTSLYAEKYNEWFKQLKEEANLTLNEINEDEEY